MHTCAHEDRPAWSRPVPIAGVIRTVLTGLPTECERMAFAMQAARQREARDLERRRQSWPILRKAKQDRAAAEAAEPARIAAGAAERVANAAVWADWNGDVDAALRRKQERLAGLATREDVRTAAAELPPLPRDGSSIASATKPCPIEVSGSAPSPATDAAEKERAEEGRRLMARMEAKVAREGAEREARRAELRAAFKSPAASDLSAGEMRARARAADYARRHAAQRDNDDEELAA